MVLFSYSYAAMVMYHTQRNVLSTYFCIPELTEVAQCHCDSQRKEITAFIVIIRI